MAQEDSVPIHSGPADSWHGKVAPNTDFAPEAGRYHMYIGLFCPFAHRANLVRHLKGLTSIIDVSVVLPYPRGDENGYPGWEFPQGGTDEYPGATKDPLFGAKYLHEVYFKVDPSYTGRYSVPLFWDRKNSTIVCNESAEMLRWLQTAFDDVLPEDQRGAILYPKHLQAQIDDISRWLKRDLNIGVYRAGFALDQAAYDKNVPIVFAALNLLEKTIHENGGPYILGKDLTELDILAYATCIRFDTVYHTYFNCNLGSIRHDYPNINEWLKNLYWNVKGFKETTDFQHIKDNYFKAHQHINPRCIAPKGPWPPVERKPNLEFSKLRVGEIGMPEVLGYMKKLERGE